MAYNNVVDTLTLEDIVPQVVDTVLRTNTFATKMLTKPKKFRAATQDFPIKYQTGTAIQSFQGFVGNISISRDAENLCRTPIQSPMKNPASSMYPSGSNRKRLE